MTFEPLNDRFIHNLEHSLAFPTTPAPSASSPASPPAGLFLSDVPGTPLNWLWPGRIPFGHLTLLDATSGCGLSLFALTLATCVSSGSPLPDGTPTLPGNVVLFAPYDSASATIKPRLQAAGGDPARVLLFRPPLEDASRTTTRTRSFALPGDLDHLANTIRRLDAQLLILDPASAIPGLSRCLPALIELAHQTNCAILLTRSLSQPPADPMRSSGPASPLQEAVRSRMLLTPDPSDERHHLLLTTRHALCAQPAILAYDILVSDGGIPAIQWLAERDRSQLARLCTGPLHSPHRQAILRFLQHSVSPRSIPQILAATCYDHEAGRKMLTRMKLAGELVSTARGLYTTSNHPSLAQLTGDPLPVPTVPTVPDIPSPTVPTVPNLPPSQSPVNSNSPQCDVPSTPAVPLIDHITSTIPTDSPVPNVPNVPNPADTTGKVVHRDASQ
jgi:AAA domain